MSGRVHRQIRKTASETAAANAKYLMPGMKAAWDNSNAAIENDKIHDRRLSDLEAHLGTFLSMTLRQRLKWVFSGTFDMPPAPKGESA